MKKRIISFITVLILLVMLLPTAVAVTVYDVKVSGTAMYDYARQALTFLNDARAKAGVAPVEMDQELLNAAMQRAAETSIYFSHTRPDGTSCFTVTEWEYTVGENIAGGYTTPEHVTEGWINSPGHYANMINDAFKSVGIGCFKSESGTLYWVQFFDGGTASAPADHQDTVKTFDIKLSEDVADLIDYPVTKGKFSDVPENKWYFEYIEYATDNGLFNGLSDTTFGPDKEMTRGMFVTVLYRLSGENAAASDTLAFSDVKSGKYYSEAVAWAARNDVVNGITPDTFEPESPVTRQQMCVMLVRYAEHKGITLQTLQQKADFTDDDLINDYAKEAVYACQRANIISGVGNNTFAPRDTATRAQVAKIFSIFHKDYIAK